MVITVRKIIISLMLSACIQWTYASDVITLSGTADGIESGQTTVPADLLPYLDTFIAKRAGEYNQYVNRLFSDMDIDTLQIYICSADRFAGNKVMAQCLTKLQNALELKLLITHGYDLLNKPYRPEINDIRKQLFDYKNKVTPEQWDEIYNTLDAYLSRYKGGINALTVLTETIEQIYSDPTANADSKWSKAHVILSSDTELRKKERYYDNIPYLGKLYNLLVSQIEDKASEDIVTTAILQNIKNELTIESPHSETNQQVFTDTSDCTIVNDNVDQNEYIDDDVVEAATQRDNQDLNSLAVQIRNNLIGQIGTITHQLYSALDTDSLNILIEKTSIYIADPNIQMPAAELNRTRTIKEAYDSSVSALQQPYNPDNVRNAIYNLKSMRSYVLNAKPGGPAKPWTEKQWDEIQDNIHALESYQDATQAFGILFDKIKKTRDGYIVATAHLIEDDIADIVNEFDRNQSQIIIRIPYLNDKYAKYRDGILANAFNGDDIAAEILSVKK